ncbi:hypothetical protein OVY01_08290 [Robbsia sp. Bb-Pol-6]|uniref:Uncharacterized protein n=1 Tax=Robbsia betulipollinis TaxID=2981849 RepID=A0ABT3ZL16_9BURK|nr:hypothetical protein [Robbsia betulipollinis]MCY0387231.1 hypothetical protein [Robbsia betulipollinis]
MSGRIVFGKQLLIDLQQRDFRYLPAFESFALRLRFGRHPMVGGEAARGERQLAAQLAKNMAR